MNNKNAKIHKYNQGTQLILFSGNEAVEDLIFEFLKDRSPLSERAYRQDLKTFFAFTSAQFNLPRAVRNKLIFEEIRHVHIVKYKKYLKDFLSNRKRSYAPNTINRKLSSVSSFFQFLLQREIVEKNPTEFCTRPNRNALEETQAFSDREMKAFFDLVIQEATPLHKAVILLLFTTGMRQAELRNLKLSNFKHQDHSTEINITKDESGEISASEQFTEYDCDLNVSGVVTRQTN